jgi:hypothetical protein
MVQYSTVYVYITIYPPVDRRLAIVNNAAINTGVCHASGKKGGIVECRGKNRKLGDSMVKVYN